MKIPKNARRILTPEQLEKMDAEDKKINLSQQALDNIDTLMEDMRTLKERVSSLEERVRSLEETHGA